MSEEVWNEMIRVCAQYSKYLGPLTTPDERSRFISWYRWMPYSTEGPVAGCTDCGVRCTARGRLYFLSQVVLPMLAKLYCLWYVTLHRLV